MDSHELHAFAKSHRFVVALTILGFLIIALILFEAGVAVGYRQASFAAHWQENYARNFGDPVRMMVLPRGIPNGNGAFGAVVSVALPQFVVDGKGEPEKTVTVGTTTIIRGAAGTASAADIAPGTFVVVIGDPGTDGSVNARFVRILKEAPGAPDELPKP